MKCQKRLSRVISMLLTFALVLGLLPTHALALGSYGEPPNSVAFKVMRMDGVRTVSPVSKYLYGTKENQFYRSIDLSRSGSWVQLTYVIEKSQPVSLELYKLNGAPPAEGPMILDYAPDADMVEEFLGDRIGYLHGVRVTDNVVPLTPDGDIDTDPQVGWNDIDPDTWLNIIYESIIQTARPAETMKDIYAFGYQGERLAGLDAAQANETGDDEQKADEVAPEENDQPAGESRSSEDFPVEDLPPEAGQPADDDQSAEDRQEPGDAIVDPEPAGTSDPIGIPDPMSTVSLELEPTESPEPIIGNVADVLGSSFSFFSERNSDTNIQNCLLWDGSIVQEEGGTPEKCHFEDGYYVIVMTPTTKSSAVYNSFLAFEVQGSDSKADSFDGINCQRQ